MSQRPPALPLHGGDELEGEVIPAWLMLAAIGLSVATFAIGYALGHDQGETEGRNVGAEEYIDGKICYSTRQP